MDSKPCNTVATAVIPLDGNDWRIAIDPANRGRKEKWYESPRADSRSTKVPWIIQGAFPGYHGVAWYWRDFVAPANPHADGRYLLRFQAVDYAGEVWVNGISVGKHEGGESPFVLDATCAVTPGGANRVAVRVLNPTVEPIDGITLGQTAHGVKRYPLAPGSVYNVGGIVDSVELVMCPAVYVEDLFVRPDSKTGVIHVDITIRNASVKSTPVLFELAVAPAAGGPTLATVLFRCPAATGDTLVQSQLQVPNPHLWELNDPYLYRVTARVWAEKSESIDDRSVRCGFREFRFENGYFRLNGRRVFPRGPLDLIQYPVGHTVPLDPDYLRRDVLAMKSMGMNIVRACFGGMTARQLDIYDEMGVMVYMENYGGWMMDESPSLEKLVDQALVQIVSRDRSHPSIIAWGLLNETHDGRLFRHAVDMLPLVRSFDDSRMVFLSSGRWDGDYRIGSLSNPGSLRWESSLRDVHAYPKVPHTAETIQMLRTLGRNLPDAQAAPVDGIVQPLFPAKDGVDTKDVPVLLSEYGTGGAIDLTRYARHYEQLEAEGAEDARYYRDKLDKFMADWQRWRLYDCWARPEDFFAESDRTMAALRLVGENALRANPNLVGRLFCAIVDSDFDGVGVLNAFRELKRGSTDVMVDVWAPLRWCLFVEPIQVYRGAKVQLEAVLANEDVLRPGEYPVRIQVMDPSNRCVFEKAIAVRIPDPKGNPEPPLALPVFAEAITIDGPSGKYRFLATFQRGAAAAGGEAEFHVADPADMPAVTREVVLWGDDPGLAKWLTDRGIRVKPFAQAAATSREVILAGAKPPSGAGAKEFRELARRIAVGSTVVFLCPGLFAKGDQPTAWAPLREKGSISALDHVGGYYRGDAFAKRHPIFDGLPAGGIMDYTFYREIIPQGLVAWVDSSSPAEVAAGGIRAQFGYGSGLLTSIHDFGAGRFILNTLRIRENLGKDPVAERLLRNMLNYAASDIDKPLADLPADSDQQLEAMGLPCPGGIGVDSIPEGDWRTTMNDTTPSPPERVTQHPEANEQLLYFTSTSLTTDDRRLVFISDRTGHPNLFDRDLVTGAERQLTHNAEGYLKSYVYFFGEPYRGFGKASVSLHAPSGTVYYLQGREIRRVDADGRERTLAEYPFGQMTAFTHVSSDGRRLCVPTTDSRALDGDGKLTAWFTYNIDERVRTEGLSSWLRVYDTETGKELLCEPVPQCWITHVQFSPIDNNLILYNHEWPSVAPGIRRMWLFDGNRHLRLRTEGEGRSRDDGACHEMWERDGSAIIYHGSLAGRGPCIGRVTADGREIREIVLTQGCERYGHFTSGAPGVLVSDGYYETAGDRRAIAFGDTLGGDWISRVDADWEKGTYVWTPLCRSNTSWDSQDAHPHPIIDHGSRFVYFTSDRDGRRAVYRIPLNPIASQPLKWYSGAG